MAAGDKKKSGKNSAAIQGREMCSFRDPAQEHPDFFAGVLYSLKAPGKHREWKHGHILFFCPTLQKNSQTSLGEREREICDTQ